MARTKTPIGCFAIVAVAVIAWTMPSWAKVALAFSTFALIALLAVAKFGLDVANRSDRK